MGRGGGRGGPRRNQGWVDYDYDMAGAKRNNAANATTNGAPKVSR